jgi:streptogramin lyase
MRTLIALLVVVAASGCLAGSSLPARSSGAGCPTGAVEANLGGQIVCLKVGASCQASLVRQYITQGFLCVQGRLAKPPAPKKLSAPAASALPAGSVSIKLPAHGALNQDIGTLAAGPGAMWVGGGLFRIAAPNNVSGPFAKGESQDIWAGDGAVWASDYDGDLVRRYDPASGKLVATIQFPRGSRPEGIVSTPGAVWVAEHHGGAVARIDPATNRIVASVKVGLVGHSGPQGIAAGLGSIWVTVPNLGEVVRIDERTNAVLAGIVVPLPASPCGGLGIVKTAVWVASCDDTSYIARIDPATNSTVSVLSPGGGVGGVATDGTNAWFVVSGCPCYYSRAEAHLVEVTPNDTVLRSIALGHGFYSGGTVIADGSIWADDWSKPLVIRIPMH